MGLYSLVIMFAPAVGPTIAGICTDVIGWRVMFLIMAGLSLSVILLAAIWLENYGEPRNIILDIPSLVLSAIGLFGLVYGFSEIGTNGKLIEALALIIVGVIMLTFFVIRQGKLEKPFLAISVLKDKQFAMGTVISMLIQASLSGAAIVLPLYIQNIRTSSGILMMPGAISSYLTGRIYDKFGARYLLIFGVFLLSLGSIGMAFFDFDTAIWMMISWYAIRSLGLMLSNTPINTWSISKLKSEQLNHGNAVSSTLCQVASTLTIAIMISAMSSTTQHSLASGADPLKASLDGIKMTFALSVIIGLIALLLVIIKIKKVDSSVSKQ